MTIFKVATALQVLYASFLVYSWAFDPWYVRDYEPPEGQVFLRGLIFPVFPHLFLGAFSFWTRNAMYCMVYLAYLTIEVSSQLFLEWLPYTMGMIDGQRYFKVMLETGSAHRILPKWPGAPGHPVPTTEATLKMCLLLLITLFSTYAVLSSPRIQRRHGNMLLVFCSLFFLLPALQSLLANTIDSASYIASSYTLVYGLLTYLYIFIAAPNSSTQSRANAAPISDEVQTKQKRD
jgi:hypothetical protein